MGMWAVALVHKGVPPQPLAVSLDTLDAVLLGGKRTSNPHLYMYGI